MNFKETMDYINSFSHSGKKVEDLSRIAGLLELLENPHKKLKFVHIAGTNGKGSVLEYCSRTFIYSGIKTGQFTSPYILTYCDRIRINGKNIPEERVVEICEKVAEKVQNNYYSQFEISFAIALLYFLEENCEVVFLETGIGGTLDATNIIENPLACIVTSISLDHTAILGNTVEEIAQHKLGIAKKSSPLIISCNNTESVVKLAEKTASEIGCRLIISDKESLEILENNIFGSRFIYKNQEYSLKMCGEHQIVNALSAIETLEILRESFDISDENIKNALENGFVNSRIEVTGENPVIIIDGGHNEAGINSLMDILEKSEIRDVTVIFGMVEGKDVSFAVDKISEIAKKVYCVDGYIGNNISSEILKGMFEDNGVEAEAYSCNSVLDKALSYARKNDTKLLVCGSLYLASAIKNIIK